MNQDEKDKLHACLAELEAARRTLDKACARVLSIVTGLEWEVEPIPSLERLAERANPELERQAKHSNRWPLDGVTKIPAGTMVVGPCEQCGGPVVRDKAGERCIFCGRGWKNEKT